jgi:hypothetical protein
MFTINGQDVNNGRFKKEKRKVSTVTFLKQISRLYVVGTGTKPLTVSPTPIRMSKNHFRNEPVD